MHKKDRVKEVIKKYINQGIDFFELTPGYLVTLDELKGFSERTLKRGRTEYKKEHKDLLKGKSKATLNIRRKMLKFLDENPKTTPDQLKKKFSTQDKKLVNEAMKVWRSENPKPANKRPGRPPKKEANGSLRQQVFNYLNENPGATLSKLDGAFESENKKTISNYLDQWRKEKTRKGKKISTKQRINDYLDQHPDSILKELKETFSDVNPSSIGAYHSLWKSGREGIAPKAGIKNGIRGISRALKIDENKLSVQSALQIIKALNNTVEAQKKAIEALKSQVEMLESSKAFSFPDLKGMSKKEIEKFERVMATFLKGLRRS
jgi:hypothetical protein